MKNLLLPLIVIGCIFSSCQNTSKGEINNPKDDVHNGLFLIIDSTMMGYINIDGNLVFELPPNIEGSFYPSEGFIGIRANKDKCGFINDRGIIVIPPQFEGVGEFSLGLANVKIDGKWGYIDEKGTIIIEPIFDLAYDFVEDLAKIKEKEKWGFINRKGEIVIESKFKSTGNFSEGLAKVEINGKWGYIDKQGKIAINPKFEAAFDFSEGLAKVKVNGKYGYINKNGEIVINPTSSLGAGSFSDGIACFNIKGKWVYINTTGKTLFKTDFGQVGDFSEGLAKVAKSGLLEVQTDKPYVPGQLNVGMNKIKWGFINPNGEIMIEPKFDEVENFSNGLAQVSIDGDWGYINKTGEFVWRSGQ